MSRFQAVSAWLSANRDTILSVLKVLGIVALFLVVAGVFLGLFGAAIAIGFPLAAAVLAAAILFFAIAWLPFAPLIFLVGIFGYRRSILTHRTRNTLVVACIAIFIGDLFSAELTGSPLFQVLNLPEAAYAGYAAILVIMSALLYVRFVYLDGLATLVGSTEKISRPVLTLLAFPSFALIAITMDLLLPFTFTAIVVDRHGCEGIAIASKFAMGVEQDYALSDRWQGVVNSISSTSEWQASSSWVTDTIRHAFDKFPILGQIQDYWQSLAVKFPELSLCGDQEQVEL